MGCGVWGDDVGEDVDGSCSVGMVTGEAKVKAKVKAAYLDTYGEDEG